MEPLIITESGSGFRLTAAIAASVGLHTLILLPMILNTGIQGNSAAARPVKITLAAVPSAQLKPPEKTPEAPPEKIQEKTALNKPPNTPPTRSETAGDSDSPEKVPSTPGVPAAANPKPTNPIVPKYPMLARKTGLEGTVVLDVDVDAQGNPLRYRAVSPRSHPILEKAAAAAAMSALYTPGSRNGTPVPGVLRLRVIFRLES